MYNSGSIKFWRWEQMPDKIEFYVFITIKGSIWGEFCFFKGAYSVNKQGRSLKPI